MTPLLHPALVNDRFGDPGLYVRCQFQRWAMLFDLGDLHALAPRELLRVRDAFVSHTHVDHFIGFDRLLRVLIGREQRVRLFGPAGFIAQVGRRLASYSWNLAERYAADLDFIVTEVHSPTEGEAASFSFRRRFVCEGRRAAALADGVLVDESGFRVRTAVLDHRIPCLAFAVEERRHVNVWKTGLDALGLPVGPWLAELKRAVLADTADAAPFRVRWREAEAEHERVLPFGELREKVLRVVAGQKLGYVVDVVHTPENERRIVELVRNADILFIEAPFAREDWARARERAHLTTEQAGRIARLAGVRRVEPFHFSPRHVGEGGRLMREVEEAFRG